MKNGYFCNVADFFEKNKIFILKNLCSLLLRCV